MQRVVRSTFVGLLALAGLTSCESSSSSRTKEVSQLQVSSAYVQYAPNHPQPGTNQRRFDPVLLNERLFQPSFVGRKIQGRSKWNRAVGRQQSPAARSLRPRNGRVVRI